MHSDRVLHRRLQEFVFVIGTQRECAIHFAREFTTIDELTSHLFLPALRTKTFHHRNAQCITANRPVEVRCGSWSCAHSQGHEETRRLCRRRGRTTPATGPASPSATRWLGGTLGIFFRQRRGL